MPPSPLISQTCRSLSLGVSMFARPNGGYFSNMCNPNRVYASLILFINASRSFGFAAIIRRTSHGKYFLKASAVHNMWHLMFLVDSLHVRCEATKSSCTYGLAFSMPVGDPLAHSCNIAIKDAISKANTFRIAGFDCARWCCTLRKGVGCWWYWWHGKRVQRLDCLQAFRHELEWLAFSENVIAPLECFRYIVFASSASVGLLSSTVLCARYLISMLHCFTFVTRNQYDLLSDYLAKCFAEIG